MGLLDMFSGEDAGLLGLYLMQAAAPRAGGRASIGEGLLGAFQGVQQHRAAKEDRAARQQQMEMQRQEQTMRMEQLKRQAAQQETDQAAMRGMFQPLPGPTQDGSQLRKGFDPAGMIQSGASLQALQQASQLDQLVNPRAKPPEFKVVGGNLVRIGGDGGVSEAYRAPEKPAADDFTRALAAAGMDPNSPQARALALQRLQKMSTHAPPPSVSVNTGQKGLDNTLKLRGDFRSEPVYKAHQEMQSAYSQIQQSLKQASPAGDLAGATKIMKLLDPGSVVRESELGMAMAASGLLDRVQNYASNVIQGTKLTPTQRADFQRLADALYGESVKQYNGKRSEYQGIAERNQLSVPDVLGTESSMPTAGGGWSIKPKGQ
jgi:hypothetical protein